MVVAIAVGRSGINALLVISQVILSIVLPFIILPLVYLTSSKTVMRVRKPRPVAVPTGSSEPGQIDVLAPGTAELESADDEMEDFSSSKVTTVVGGLIWLLILAANMYVIVTLAMGNGG